VAGSRRKEDYMLALEMGLQVRENAADHVVVERKRAVCCALPPLGLLQERYLLLFPPMVASACTRDDDLSLVTHLNFMSATPFAIVYRHMQLIH
jgi:hypothetical protein